MNRPWGFFWCNIAVLAASQLTGMRVLPGPDWLGISLAFYALIILPGLVAWRLIPAEAGVSVDGAVRVFLTGLSAASGAACLGFVPNVSYTTISIVYTAITAAGLVAVLVRSRAGGSGRVPFPGRERSERSERRLILAAFVLVFVILFVMLDGIAENGVETDAPDHLSFMRRSLDSGKLLPHDSFYRGGDGQGFDQRKGLWHPVLALLARQADTPPEILWRSLPAFLGLFAMLAFWGFAGELVGGIPMKLLALVFLLFVYRGEGVGWFAKLGYSRNIAQVVSWGTIMIVLKFLRGSRMTDVAAAALWSAAGTAIHPVYAVITGTTMLSLFVYTLFSREGRAWKRRYSAAAASVVVPIAIVAGVRVAGAAGTVNIVHAHLQGMLELGGGLRMIDPVELVMRFDRTILFACAFTPFLFFLGRNQSRERLVGTLFGVPALLALFPPIATLLERAMGYFHIRILHAAPAACLLALATAGLFSIFFRGPSRRREGFSAAAARFGAALAFILLLLSLRPAARRLEHDVRRLLSREDSVEVAASRIAGALAGLPPHSVIVSDPATSYLISAFTDHFVVVTFDQHGVPSDTTALERMARTRDLFDPALPISESADWLRREEAGYVLFDSVGFATGDFFGVTAGFDPTEVFAKLGSSPGLVARPSPEDGMRLYAVSRADLPHSTERGAVRMPPVCAPDTSGEFAGIDAGPFVAAGFWLGPDTIAAGDTLRVNFCWLLEEPVAFGLPFYWTLRLDTDFPRGSFYRDWYGKQYRRVVERRDGVYYRYTAAGRIISGTALPDRWPAGVPLGQSALLPIPRSIAPGTYTVRLCVERRAYLANRTPADYLRNEDTLWGTPVGTVIVGRAGPPAED